MVDSTPSLVSVAFLAPKDLRAQSSTCKLSLSKMTEFVLNLSMPKPLDVRTGNWEQKPLSQEQIKYAATDAFACRRIWEELSKKPDCAEYAAAQHELRETERWRGASQGAKVDPTDDPTPRLIPAVAECNESQTEPVHELAEKVYQRFHKGRMYPHEIASMFNVPCSLVMRLLYHAVKTGRAYRWEDFLVGDRALEAIRQHVDTSGE